MTNAADRKEKLEAWVKVDIEKIIENLDYTEIHKLAVFSDYGTSILVWDDGEVSTLGSGTTPNTSRWYATIPSFGRGNIDESSYAEGWAEEDDDGNYVDEEGKTMDSDEMLTICIETGEWSDWENGVADGIREQYNEDIQALEYQIEQDENQWQ